LFRENRLYPIKAQSAPDLCNCARDPTARLAGFGMRARFTQKRALRVSVRIRGEPMGQLPLPGPDEPCEHSWEKYRLHGLQYLELCNSDVIVAVVLNFTNQCGTLLSETTPHQYLVNCFLD
jgi:hypothetical protein